MENIKKVNSCLKKSKGFSLIELLVVVGIIGILAAVGIPAYQNYTDKAAWGVSDSIIQLANRTIQLNKSLGEATSKDALLGIVKTKGNNIDTSEFVLDPDPVPRTFGANYCVEIKNIPAENDLFAGCGGSVVSGGTCSDTSYSTKDDCTGAGDAWTPTYKFNTVKNGTCSSAVCS